MIIERLQMQNFKRFADEDIRFSDGITGIVGNNGSGKSTIVEAVLFALYGVKSSGLEGDYITSSFAPGDAQTFVSLDFSVAGTAYRVWRKFKKGKSIRHEAQLSTGENNLLADGVSGVEREVSRIIGMGPADFRKTIYAAQKDLLSLIGMTPSERRDWFMRMLGIDDIKKESDSLLKDEIAASKKKISEREFYLAEHDPASLEERIGEISREEESIDSRVRDLSAEKEKVDGELSVKKDLLSTLGEKQEEHFRITGEMVSLKERIVSLEDTLLRQEKEREDLKTAEEEYRSLLPGEEAYPGLKSEYIRQDGMRQEHESLVSRKRMLDESVSSLSSTLDEKKSYFSHIVEAEDLCRILKPLVDERDEVVRSLDEMSAREKEYISTENRLEQARKRFETLEGDVKKARERISLLEEELAGSPPVNDLEMDLKEEESSLSEMDANLGSLAEKVASARSGLSSLEEQIAEVETTGPDGECPTCRRRLGDQYRVLIDDYAARKAEIEGSVAGYLEEQAMLKAKIGDQRSSLDSMRRDLETCRQKHERLSMMKDDLSSLFTETEDCLTVESALEAQLSLIAYSPDEMKRLKERKKELDGHAEEYIRAAERAGMRGRVEKECADLENRISAQSKELESVISSIERIGYSAEEYKAAKEEFEKAEAEHQRYLDLKPRMVTIPLIENAIKERMEDISRTGRKVSALGKELDELAFSPDEYASARSGLDELTEKSGSLAALLSGLAAEARAFVQERKGLEAELKRTRNYEKDCLKLKEEISLLETTKRIIGEYLLYLMQMIREQIEAETARVLSEITDGRYDQVIIDNDFNILVSDTGEFFPVRRFSGGEQDDIAVALRVALSRFLSRMFRAPESTFLIFDEIFGSQDEERRSNLMRALRTQESLFPQIFLISHVGDIQGEFSHTLLVEMENAESSRVMEVDI